MRKTEDKHHQDGSVSQLCQNLMRRTVTLILLGTLAACGPREPQESTHEIHGTKEERVAVISKLISTAAPLPGAILDAHFIEEQTGDGRLGPSDFRAFYALTVAPDDLALWRSALPPMKSSMPSPGYATPKQPRDWWTTQKDFDGLEFFSPKSLTGRSNGWIGIAPDGRIFIYAYTM